MERIMIGQSDIAQWKVQGRLDILAQLGEQSGWRTAGPCPFIAALPDNRFGCSIYETRPSTCREYPLAVNHMRFVDCEMLEPGDTDADIAAFMAHPEKAA
jgi:Fe-S-cluster containining protein